MASKECIASIVKDPFTSETHENDLIIQMVATGKYLLFKDGIDSFSRSYNISWESVSVYGRQDAIQTYQSTGETINLTFPLKPGDNPEVFNMQLEALLALRYEQNFTKDEILSCYLNSAYFGNNITKTCVKMCMLLI